MKTILSTSIESLKKDQHDYLQQFAIQRLQSVINRLKEEKYEVNDWWKTREFWESFSWSNWDYNVYINFKDCWDETIQDISDVFEKLLELSK